MNKLKVCFVGVGSIGKRHIRNLYDICQEKSIDLEIHALRTNVRKLDEDIENLIYQTFTDDSAMRDDYDVIFLTNPTSLHLDTLKKLHDKANHFFIEKPLTSYEKMDEVFNIPYRKNSVYYVACPLRYNKVIQYFKANLNIRNVISVRCISSSYLPEWRPGSDYRMIYSADKTLGGGVSLDLIHEWDYIRYLFGDPQNIFYAYGKKSLLELKCEDYAVYVAEYEDKVLELHYFGRKAIREIMVFTDEDTIVGDLVQNQIHYLKQGKEICFEDTRDELQKRELVHFLNMIEGNAECDNNIRNAYRTIQFTRGEI